jgi:spore coat protein U-like protein
VSAADVLTAAKYDWVQAAVHVTASGRELRMNSGRESLINLVRSRIEVARATAANNMSRDLYSDGALANQMNGLANIIQTNGQGTVGGIDSATYTWWRNKFKEMSGAGTYADTLTFRLFDAAGASPVQLGTDRTAPAQARIEARAQLNIAGTSGSFGAFELDEIDFGALSTGATRNAVVQVRATRPVSITLSSQNLGLLKHQDLPSAAGVPYALQLDGASVDLTAGGFGLARTPALNLNGTSYPMTVTIMDTNGRAAGAYKDRLTITVTPQ